VKCKDFANLKSAQRSEIWGQHFSFFPGHLISETLFKVAHCSGIAIDAKTFNGKIN